MLAFIPNFGKIRFETPEKNVTFSDLQWPLHLFFVSIYFFFKIGENPFFFTKIKKLPSMTFEVKLHIMKICVFIMLVFILNCIRSDFKQIRYRIISGFLNKKTTLCSLQWPLKSYIIKWKTCVFTILAFMYFHQNRLIYECGRKNFS